MEKILLGSSDLNVSKVCLGTMTFGEQNTEAEGHSQLDYALERGLPFAIVPCCVFPELFSERRLRPPALSSSSLSSAAAASAAEACRGLEHVDLEQLL